MFDKFSKVILIAVGYQVNIPLPPHIYAKIRSLLVNWSAVGVMIDYDETC